VVFETDDEQLAYKRLTERWDSDIILTSMVQFMNAVYRKENTNARRMHQLSDSVIIFDEIQALPNQCIRLFEKAIEFLTKFCGCTLLLCTATQPKLEFKQDVYALIPNELDIHKKLKRVMYIPQLKRNKTFVEAAFEILPFLQDGKSVLMIVNTKIAAFEIFANAKENLINVGFVPVKIDENISDEEIESLSETCSDNEILCIHLSTLMCSEHRKKLLKWLKIWNAKKKKVLCVSTALIEAGINVSFPVVVRSLAGLPSIVQAAGRCNRNMELECGEVYIWDLKEENLTKLADVQHGKDISRQIICNMNESDMNLDNPEMIEKYFEKMEPYLENEKGDPIVKEFIHEPSTLFRMLSKNTKFKMNAGSNLDKLSFYQSFKTAGEAFHVIDENTRSVLVPYGRGKEIIEQLGNAYLTATEKNRLLKEAQRYSVNLYKNVFERLRDKEKAIVTIGNDEILTLREGYYDLEVGICTEKQELEDMIY
jgi:CRISPR-associated endonuclease/helicase Cas3